VTTSTGLPKITNIAQPKDGEAGPDQRSWLATLEAAGQLRRVTAPVDWNEEIGAITRANLSLGGPALLFENIIGHENTRCTKLLTSALGNRRQVQLMLGLPKDTSDSAIVRHLREAFKKPIPPRVVKTGPVKENIVEGDAINLWELPVPKWHGGDGGRYIDTFCGCPARAGAAIWRNTSQSQCRSPSSMAGTTCCRSAPAARSRRTSANGT
jgi:4-hydroxy-3-polyprenylbenzoate decarboxylase